MPIERVADCAQCTGVVSVDDAERLLGLLQDDAPLTVDLSECTHLHAANLQVLMAASPAVVAWPSHAHFAMWLRAALSAR